jgi:uncharacterized protein
MKIPLITLWLLVSVMVYGQPDIPAQGGFWVHDLADVLSPQVKARLESIIRVEEDSTSNQIGVLIIRSLEGGSLEEYSLRVAEAWKIGRKDRDNGVLLLISIDDRKMRIETGYGLEGALTDAMASRIIRNEIAPSFRQGDYAGGVEAGLKGIIKAIKGEYVNENPRSQKRNTKKFPLGTIIIIIIILIIASRSRRGGGGGGHWSSGRGWIGPIGGGIGSSGSWGSGGGGFGGSFGGGGGFGGGGSSGSW